MKRLLMLVMYLGVIGCGEPVNIDGTVAVSWDCSTSPGSSVQLRHQVFLYEDPDADGNDTLTTCSVSQTGSSARLTHVWKAGSVEAGEGRCLVNDWTFRLTGDSTVGEASRSGADPVQIACTITYHTGP